MNSSSQPQVVSTLTRPEPFCQTHHPCPHFSRGSTAPVSHCPRSQPSNLNFETHKSLTQLMMSYRYQHIRRPLISQVLDAGCPHPKHSRAAIYNFNSAQGKLICPPWMLEVRNKEVQGACGVFFWAKLAITFGVVMYRLTNERWMGNQDWPATWMKDWNARLQQHWSTLDGDTRNSKQD